MQVLYVSSEAYPLAKSGGLADVSAALPKALAAQGADIRLLHPGYPDALRRLAGPVQRVASGSTFGFPFRLVLGRMPDSRLPVYLLDCPALYARPGGLYQDASGLDWPDNGLRSGALCRIATTLALGRLDLPWRPHVVHLNDWHTGPAAALMALEGRDRPGTIFTVHNMAFQGLFPLDCLPPLGLEGPSFASVDGVEFYGQASFLKAGLRFADAVTTVSPTYAREIVHSEFGCGLEGVLAARSDGVAGILNGIDDELWNPAADPMLPANYDAAKLSGKRICKMALQAELRLECAAERPLLAFVSRLTAQKMADILLQALPAILELGVEVAVHGAGDPNLEQAFEALPLNGDGRLAVRIGYEERLAHRLHAGADIVLAPARFEPCGLTQLYAMRYGALPVVRRVGGLADTVVDAGAGPGAATGFVFGSASPADLLRCVERAVEAYLEPVRWRRMQLAAMSQDNSWERSAARCAQFYRQLAEDRKCASPPPAQFASPRRSRAAGGSLRPDHEVQYGS